MFASLVRFVAESFLSSVKELLVVVDAALTRVRSRDAVRLFATAGSALIPVSLDARLLATADAGLSGITDSV